MLSGSLWRARLEIARPAFRLLYKVIGDAKHFVIMLLLGCASQTPRTELTLRNVQDLVVVVLGR